MAPERVDLRSFFCIVGLQRGQFGLGSCSEQMQAKLTLFRIILLPLQEKKLRDSVLSIPTGETLLPPVPPYPQRKKFQSHTGAPADSQKKKCTSRLTSGLGDKCLPIKMPPSSHGAFHGPCRRCCAAVPPKAVSETSRLLLRIGRVYSSKPQDDAPHRARPRKSTHKDSPNRRPFV